jgi:branched-chain amino acid transport system ATP-binding protein
VTALREASLHVDAGEVVAVIGSNGAGKSTLMKALAGALPPISGRIVFNGEDATRCPPNEVVASGINLVAEGRRIFPNLTVRDNLLLGGYVHRKDRKRVVTRQTEMYELFPILADRLMQMAGSLSGGQQQMLAIAQALMAEPQLLLLDEPSLGLAPSVVADVLKTIETLRGTGITIVVVEQMVRQALELADRGYVLQTGRVVRSGTAEELRKDEVVREAYLGLVVQ